ncbi:hypothetical protein MsAg5_01340 [Methanosarcinaceae archaeon Ag5]|uniref:Uncharacterized protein n=1 Tax=Methanolapillus africanus TaxID=3028297 RepID=A0AAE4SD15_9EURY|nr:hypothetical protein [Methanosarcinaceae archaeon Ag5]
MGWIKNPPNRLEDDRPNTKLNLLFNRGNIYVMDNHLAAAYVWLQKLDASKDYNYFHIDQHYDLGGPFPKDLLGNYPKLISDNQKMDLDSFIDLKFEGNPLHRCQLFQWDNYISLVYQVFPQWFKRRIFSCHGYRDRHLASYAYP